MNVVTPGQRKYDGTDPDLPGGWLHEDGTPCPEYLAPADGTRWWCTEHQQHLKRPGDDGAAAAGKTPGQAAEPVAVVAPRDSVAPELAGDDPVQRERVPGQPAPVTVEAFKWAGDWDTLTVWLDQFAEEGEEHDARMWQEDDGVTIQTPEGDRPLRPGDWIVRSADGFRPVSPGIFEAACGPVPDGAAGRPYGQAAYEGMAARALTDDGPKGASTGWDHLESWQQGRWTASAQAVLDRAFPGLRGQLNEARAHAASLAADLDDAGAAIADYRDALTAMQAERDKARRERDTLRELVTEILASLGPRPNGISNPQIAKWRQRAGLEG